MSLHSILCVLLQFEHICLVLLKRYVIILCSLFLLVDKVDVYIRFKICHHFRIVISVMVLLVIIIVITKNGFESNKRVFKMHTQDCIGNIPCVNDMPFLGAILNSSHYLVIRYHIYPPYNVTSYILCDCAHPFSSISTSYRLALFSNSSPYPN